MRQVTSTDNLLTKLPKLISLNSLRRLQLIPYQFVILAIFPQMKINSLILQLSEWIAHSTLLFEPIFWQKKKQSKTGIFQFYT